jgi:hypothetical protein
MYFNTTALSLDNCNRAWAETPINIFNGYPGLMVCTELDKAPKKCQVSFSNVCSIAFTLKWCRVRQYKKSLRIFFADSVHAHLQRIFVYSIVASLFYFSCCAVGES